jgi:hypothetical protein
MTRNVNSLFLEIANRQGVNALLAATFGFLRTNNIPKRQVLDSIRQSYEVERPKGSVRQYRKLMLAYEDMGIVMSTWFSVPRFLDRDCRPQRLALGSGPRSIGSLVRASRVSISAPVAVEMMRRSPSVKFDESGTLLALRREFVLPNFEIPRAALVIERYLDTLHRNFSPHNRKGILLLERNCHVPKVSLESIAPILRDIKHRGSAYIDSVNGDIEGLRPKRSRPKGTGEMSVHIFAWTRLPRTPKSKLATRANRK